MEISLTLPDDIGKQIQHLPNPSEFVSKAVKDALKNLTKLQVQKDSESSKWAKIAQRIHNDPVHLAGYSQQLKKDMREFRENFEFIHDKTSGR
jgi:homospermidine synthase